MKTLRTTTHIGPGGAVSLSLPIVPEMAGEDVEVLVVLSSIVSSGNGLSASENREPRKNGVDLPGGRWEPGASIGPKPSSDERRLRLNKAIGSIDDPTFQRPPQGEYEKLEPLD